MDLVGYVLKVLDPDSQREVEAYLRAHPEGQRQVERLRQALAPLAADRDGPAPPPDLRIRTLARVAEYRCRQFPRVLPAPPVRPAPVPRSWWRRADVLVAASLLLLAGGLAFSWVAYLQREHNKLACQNNLRAICVALLGYSDHHGGDLPKVEKDPPHNFAGVFVPILLTNGFLEHDVSVGCPANGCQPPLPIALETLDRLYQTDPERFEQYAHQLGGCYAYTLGYRDAAGQHHGLRIDPIQPHDWLPILADRPPFDQPDSPDRFAGNSPNHGGTGQNVLYLGGQVLYRTQRCVGEKGDDIYLNDEGQLQAGLNLWDAVLGASPVHPYPEPSPILDH